MLVDSYDLSLFGSNLASHEVTNGKSNQIRRGRPFGRVFEGYLLVLMELFGDFHDGMYQFINISNEAAV